MTSPAEAFRIIQDLVERDRRPEGDALRKSLEVWLAMTPLPEDRDYDERDRLIVAAVDRHCGKLTSVNAKSIRLATALSAYFAGRWRQDRFAAEIDYGDTLEGACWRILKMVDVPVGAERIRKLVTRGCGAQQSARMIGPN